MAKKKATKAPVVSPLTVEAFQNFRHHRSFDIEMARESMLFQRGQLELTIEHLHREVASTKRALRQLDAKVDGLNIAMERR